MVATQLNLAIQPGHCQCGCGQQTSIATRNRPELGWVKGQPKAYVVGHNHRYRFGPKVPVGKKWCGQCQRVKNTTDFHKNVNAASGLQGICKECARKRTAAYRDKHRDKDRGYALNWRLRRKFGVTRDEYNRLLETQNHHCAICGEPEHRMYKDGTPQNMVVDHDHTTGRVRGLLCNNCNRALGLFGDNPERLHQALAYLASHG